MDTWNATRATLGERDGRELAVQMLHQFAAAEGCGEFDPCSLDPTERAPATPQRNIVLSYLQTVRDGGPDFERGFAAVLTDYLGNTCNGLVPSAALYEALLDG